MGKQDYKKNTKTSKLKSKESKSKIKDDIDNSENSDILTVENVMKQLELDMKNSSNNKETNKTENNNVEEIREPQMIDFLVSAAKLELKRMEEKENKNKKSNLNKKNQKEINIQSRRNRKNENIASISPQAEKFIQEVEDLEFPVEIFDNEKKYFCVYTGCKKNFPSSSRVKRHYKTHFDIHPYKCVTCGRTFGRKDNMMQHFERCKRK